MFPNGVVAMSAPDDILAKMRRAWNRDPSGVALGTERTGLSAALWICDSDDVQEIRAEPDPAQHIVVLQFRSFAAEWFLDEEPQFSGAFRVGDVSLVPAGVRPRAVMRGRYRCLHIYLPDRVVEQCAEAEAQGPRRVQLAQPRRGKARDDAIERVGREILAEMREDQPLSRLRVDALGQELAVQLLRAHSNLAGMRRAQGSAGSGLAPWQARRVAEHLSARLAEDMALADIAALVGLSPYHFARAFSSSTGLPPHRYQVTLRVERAKEMLADTSMTVTEIAHACGFASSQHMATVFRRMVGTAPTAYRKELSR
jgi:AraC family transcriptional regulator